MSKAFAFAGVVGAVCSFSALAAAPLFGAGPVSSCLRPGASVMPVAACAAPGTDPEYAAAFYAWMLDPNGVDYNLTTRWNSTILGGFTTLGNPTTVTYSFPADTLTGIGGGITNQNVLNAKMAQWFGSVANGKAKFRQIFDRWEAISGLRYVETNDDSAAWGSGGVLNVRGEIRIVSINIDGGSNILAFNSFPSNGDMVIDSSENFGSATADFLFFRNVIAHEAGHGFGLLHVCPAIATKLMEPFISTSYDGPRHDDTRAIQSQYGDTLENNDTSATANNLGALTLPLAVTNVSINALNDADFYRVTSGVAAANVDVTATPIGFTYDSSTQAGNGSCNSGNIINTNNVQDLVLEVLAANGVTVLASANLTGLGGIESITGVALAPNTNYFLHVRSNNTGVLGNQSQLYRLDVVASALPPCPGDANGDRVINFQDLNIVLGQFGQSGPGLAGDVTGDGTVNFSDLNLVLSNFGISC